GAAVLRDERRRPVGVRDADGEVHSARDVVIAAGHAAGKLASGAPVRPVKGQILRLRAAPGAAVPLARTVRTPDVYLAPRGDEVVVGATVEERADRHATAGAVADLLEDALRACPELRELELAEVGTGLRPATADGRPSVGRDADGLIHAVGGYRHGLLLAPLVAAAVVDLVARAGTVPAGPLAPFVPGRFAQEDGR
ncbi:MAG: FAD-dependent oxidoreductase, partial [Miltoncostaeaceae bacterium]